VAQQQGQIAAAIRPCCWATSKKIQALLCGKFHHRDSGVPVMSELEASCQATRLSVVGTIMAGPYRRKIKQTSWRQSGLLMLNPDITT